MKLIIIFISLINGVCFFKYTKEIINVENVIYSLYINDFYDYLAFDDNYNLCIDEYEFKEYLESYGYTVMVRKESGNLMIDIGFKYIIEFEKEYLFYMVKNDE